MSQFEMIVVGLLLTMVFGMFVIGKLMVIMINSRLINRKIEQHNLIDLESSLGSYILMVRNYQNQVLFPKNY